MGRKFAKYAKQLKESIVNMASHSGIFFSFTEVILKGVDF